MVFQIQFWLEGYEIFLFITCNKNDSYLIQKLILICEKIKLKLNEL